MEDKVSRAHCDLLFARLLLWFRMGLERAFSESSLAIMEGEMRKNIIPAIIAFAPALLLPLIQDVMRPRMSHAGLLGFVLSWAPDFVIGFCFPFSILIRPGAWTSRVAAHLFSVWAVFTVVVLVLIELLSPLGSNVFDPADITGGVGGVALAVVFFHTLVRSWLTFGEDEPGLGRGQLPSESLQCQARPR